MATQQAAISLQILPKFFEKLLQTSEYVAARAGLSQASLTVAFAILYMIIGGLFGAGIFALILYVF